MRIVSVFICVCVYSDMFAVNEVYSDMLLFIVTFPGVDQTREASWSSLAGGERWPCCMLSELWRRTACTTHDWWSRSESQHTKRCLALTSQLREVEEGEGGVGVYGTMT